MTAYRHSERSRGISSFRVAKREMPRQTRHGGVGGRVAAPRFLDSSTPRLLDSSTPRLLDPSLAVSRQPATMPRELTRREGRIHAARRLAGTNRRHDAA